jgi:hypothetical protein
VQTEKYWYTLDEEIWVVSDISGSNIAFTYRAPDVAELGLLLPAGLMIDENYHWLEINKADATYLAGYRHENSTPYSFTGEYWACKYIKTTEAGARAETLIWMLENNHIKPEDLKL